MPIWKFVRAEEADDVLRQSVAGEGALRTALVLATLDEAARLGVRISQRGVHKYRTVAEGEADREHYALARLRSAAG